jgi:hypothetical protein
MNRVDDYNRWARSAFIASAIVNVNTRGKRYRIKDFIGAPPWGQASGETPRRMSRKEQLNELRKIKERMGET